MKLQKRTKRLHYTRVFVESYSLSIINWLLQWNYGYKQWGFLIGCGKHHSLGERYARPTAQKQTYRLHQGLKKCNAAANWNLKVTKKNMQQVQVQFPARLVKSLSLSSLPATSNLQQIAPSQPKGITWYLSFHLFLHVCMYVCMDACVFSFINCVFFLLFWWKMGSFLFFFYENAFIWYVIEYLYFSINRYLLWHWKEMSYVLMKIVK